MMLGTIRVPKNLRLLSERLPKSNYGTSSRKKETSKLDTAVLSKASTINDTNEMFLP